MKTYWKIVFVFCDWEEAITWPLTKLDYTLKSYIKHFNLDNIPPYKYLFKQFY